MSDSDSAPVRLRAEGVEFTEVEGEVVVLDLETSAYFAVNDTGAVLWDALRRGTTAGELTALMVSAYDVPAETAAADVAAFLDQLQAQRLLDDAPR